MNSVLLWIGGALIAALGLLFAVPAMIDWNSFRGVFEEEASRVLGRDVRVGGKVNLRLLPAPYVRFEKVRISDTDGSLGEPFFRTEAFTLWLSAMPLLRGAIEANEIDLDGPVLRLAVGADGTGNWQKLKQARGALPFVPSDVVLQQIRIRGGTVSVKTPEHPEPVELAGIDGELSAASLAGPYRFRGTVAWDSEPRELRVAVAPQDDDGKLRFKLSVRVPTSANTYNFDGSLSELTTKARLEGSLTARLPIRPGPPSGPSTQVGAPPTDSAPSRSAADQDAFDLKAAVAGTIEAVKLSDIEISYERDGKPQLLTGSASASWRGGLRLETQLAARWLDLDRISAAGAERPLDAARELIERVGAMLPADGTTFASLDVDQVNLGGEALSGLRLAVARAAGRTSIGELRAGLPGNAKATIRGVIGGGGDPRAFEGEIVLRGASYQRFAGWAGRPPAAAGAQAVPRGDGRGDGAFSLASQLRMKPGQLVLSGATVEFAGAQLQGDLEWTWEGQKELKLSLDGTTVDVSAVAPGLLDLSSWNPAAGGDGAETPSPLVVLGAKARLVNAAVGHLSVKVHAQTLTDGVDKIRDVDADLSFEPARIAISGLRFVSPAGATIDVQGEINALETTPSGRLRGWIQAAGAGTVQSLSAALAGPGSPIPTSWAARLARVDLGFDAEFGGAASGRMKLRANGTIDDSRLELGLVLDGGLKRWRDAPIDLIVRLDGPELPALVRKLGSGRDSAGIAAGPDGAAGSLVIKSVGSSAAALMSYGQLDSGSMGLSFSGPARIVADGAVELTGTVNVVAADVSDLLTLAGAERRPYVPGISVEGAIAVQRSQGKASLSSRALTLGSSRISGRLDVGLEGERMRLDGALAANQVSLPSLLGIVLDGRQLAAKDGGEGNVDALWPETPFALTEIDGLDGRITLSTPSLTLPGNLTVEAAEMAFDLAPGRVTLSKLTGNALGGRLTARTVIERAPSGSGATVRLEGSLAGAELGRLVSMPGSAAPALGRGSLSVSIEGRGGSPRAAMAAMTGKGEVDLAGARVRGLGAGAVDKAAQALIDGQDDIQNGQVEQVVKGALAGSQLQIANSKLAIDVTDGALKIAPLQVETTDARLRNVTTVDLASLKLDSEWQIAPKRSLPGRSGAQPKPPLPPVSLVWSGSVAQLAALQPRLSVDALEREITVRKIERDVERLEQLRKLDEERARQEAERMKRVDEAARGPGAGAPPPVVIQAPFNIPAPLQVPRPLPATPPQSGPAAAPR